MTTRETSFREEPSGKVTIRETTVNHHNPFRVDTNLFTLFLVLVDAGPPNAQNDNYKNLRVWLGLVSVGIDLTQMSKCLIFCTGKGLKCKTDFQSKMNVCSKLHQSSLFQPLMPLFYDRML